MGVLRVSKKAATTADAKKILDATYRIDNPFDVGVIHVRNNEFYTAPETMLENLSQKFKAALEAHTGMELRDAEPIKQLLSSRTSLMGRLDSVHKGAFFSQQSFAIQDNLGKPQNLFIPFIIGPDENIDLQVILGEHIPDEINTDFTKAQLQFYMMWHENAHLTGCDEAQADMISAIMTRRCFENTIVLDIMADSRMIEIYTHDLDKAPELLEYGWKCAQAFDAINHIDPAQLEAITEENFWEIACMEYDSHNDLIRKTFKAVEDRYLELNPETKPGEISAGKLRETIQDLTDNQYPKGTKENAFLSRLHLAFKRVMNPALYNDPHIGVDLDQTLYTFPKDVPKCLPVPSSLLPR